MKIKLLTFFFLCYVLNVSAQNSNAIFFTENGEHFQVVLNGILQNSKAETNVKLTGLNAPYYKTRILFEDKTLGYVDYNLNFVNQGMEVSYSIRKNSKGNYVVRYVSEVPLAQAPPSAPNQAVIVFSPAPPATSSTTTVKQTTTTTSSGNPDNVNINMGMNVDGQGGNFNMNVSGMDNSNSSSTTTTTTHSTTTTTVSDNTPPPAHVVYVQDYYGTIGCPVPMNQGDFQSFKSSVSSKSFEDSKLTIAKQVLNNNCLTSAQVRETLGLFSFEDSKLDFAKYAYGHTYDINNYYKVNDAFTYESSIEELNTYINSQK